MQRLKVVSLAIAWLCLVTPSLSGAPPGALGAVVSSWDIDASKNTVTLHLVNNSGKDITFYNISIKETYGQHVNAHQFSEDLVGIMLAIADPNDLHQQDLRETFHGGNGTWQAGATRDKILVVQPNMTGYEAVIDTVIYADKTAETANPDALNRALQARKYYAQTLETANESIRHALANQTDKSPHETAAKELERHSGSGAEGGVALELRGAPRAASYLKQTVPDFLNNLVSQNSRRAAQFLEHATVNAKAGGAQ